eukprot:10224798-Heterocapsa_arctica.AAC.1
MKSSEVGCTRCSCEAAQFVQLELRRRWGAMFTCLMRNLMGNFFSLMNEMASRASHRLGGSASSALGRLHECRGRVPE